MEQRVTKLEVEMSHVQERLREHQSDVARIAKEVSTINSTLAKTSIIIGAVVVVANIIATAVVARIVGSF